MAEMDSRDREYKPGGDAVMGAGEAGHAESRSGDSSGHPDNGIRSDSPETDSGRATCRSDRSSDLSGRTVTTQVHPEDSPNESVHDNQAPVQIVRLSLPKEARELLIACSVVALVVLIFLYRYDAQERDLDRYDDGQRQERVDKELADLRAELKVDHELIQAYGLQNAVKGK